MESHLTNDYFTFNRSTNSSFGPSVNFLSLPFFWLMTVCNIANIIAIVGIISVHSKLFKIESLSLLLICITHFICLIIFTLPTNICDIDILGYVLQIFHVFLLVLISLNRTHVIYLSFVRKKQVMIQEKHKISIFKRYMKPATFVFAGFLTISVAFYLPFLILNKKKWGLNLNCTSGVSQIYLLFLQSYTVLFLNALLLINYLIVIPYLMIRYTNHNIRNRRSTINSILRLFIYSFTNVISFTFYAVIRIFEINNQLGSSLNNPLNLISHVFYNLEPFILIITHSKILSGLFKLFEKLKK